MRMPQIRVSLRLVLVCVTVLCIYLGLIVEHARRQRELVHRVEQSDGAVLFAYQRRGDSDDADFNPHADPPWPEWIRRVLGEDLFRNVVYVNLTGTEITDEWLRASKLVNSIEYLMLDLTPITDTGIASVATCHQLRVLSLDGTRITNTGVAKLTDLHHLRYLSVAGTAISDDAMTHLIAIRSLSELNVSGTAVTNAAIERYKDTRPHVTFRHD